MVIYINANLRHDEFSAWHVYFYTRFIDLVVSENAHNSLMNCMLYFYQILNTYACEHCLAIDTSVTNMMTCGFKLYF